jgi:hypothetical protein
MYNRVKEGGCTFSVTIQPNAGTTYLLSYEPVVPFILLRKNYTGNLRPINLTIRFLIHF